MVPRFVLKRDLQIPPVRYEVVSEMENAPLQL